MVAHRDRSLRAARDLCIAIAVDTARDRIVAHDLSAPCAKRDAVFARAAPIGVAFERVAVTVALQQLLLLLVERGMF